MTTWTSAFSPFRNAIDADVAALAAAVRRTEADIAVGDKRGWALGAVAGRFGMIAAARMSWATDARWRVAEMRVGGDPGAVRVVETAVNRKLSESRNAD